jgi:hypothetical protein
MMKPLCVRWISAINADHATDRDDHDRNRYPTPLAAKAADKAAKSNRDAGDAVELCEYEIRHAVAGCGEPRD